MSAPSQRFVARRCTALFINDPPQPGRDLAEAHRALQVTNMRLARDLANAREQGEAWKTLAQNVQEMQEMAMAAFERCNALEKENVELRHAMYAFAEGSASVTIQQLQRIISSLTGEVTQYKKREEDLKTKEKSLRSKENNVIIKAMRKQTKELKVGRGIARCVTCHTHSRLVAALAAVIQAHRGDSPREQEYQHTQRRHANREPAEEPA